MMKTAVNVFAFMACKNSPWVNFEKGTGYTNRCHTKRIGGRKNYKLKNIILPVRWLGEGECLTEQMLPCQVTLVTAAVNQTAPEQ